MTEVEVILIVTNNGIYIVVAVGTYTSANPLFRDSTYSNYHNSTVFDSTYSICCHMVPVPWEHSSDTVRLQYVLHKVTSQNFSKSHCLPHPHHYNHMHYEMFMHDTATPTLTTPPQHNCTCRYKVSLFVLFCILTIITGPLCAHPHLHTPTPVQPAFPCYSYVSFLFLFTNYYYQPIVWTPAPRTCSPATNTDQMTVTTAAPNSTNHHHHLSTSTTTSSPVTTTTTPAPACMLWCDHHHHHPHRWQQQ